jgi:hypothetical protein
MICAWLFVPRFLPFIWIFTGLISVFSFFYFSTVLSKQWLKLDSNLFQKNIFLTALIIRTVYVIIIYFFYQSKNGMPFEFAAGDSYGYHKSGNWIVDMIYWGGLDYYFKEYRQGISDTGWELMVAFFYLISFRSILFVRLVNAFLSAWMVVMIYKISKRNFGEPAARISAVMAILLPAFWYYSGTHLKETMMVFLLIFFIERADNLLHSKRFTFWNILQVALLGTSLFFFRTVLAAAAWFAVFSALLLSSNKMMKQYHRTVIIIWFIIASLFVFSGKILDEVSEYAGMRQINQEQKFEHFSTRIKGNKLAKYGNAAIFIPLIIPAPFPTLVNIPEQQNTMMINGDLFTRNIYVFFVFIAFYVLYKQKKLRENIMLSVFLFSYLLILANSGYALSPRFHVPAMPFFLIFAGYGITQTKRNFSSYYVLYVIGISIVVVAWNWFKLEGRGLA